MNIENDQSDAESVEQSNVYVCLSATKDIFANRLAILARRRSGDVSRRWRQEIEISIREILNLSNSMGLETLLIARTQMTSLMKNTNIKKLK